MKPTPNRLWGAGSPRGWFTRRLRSWAKRSGRDFAWRHTNDPYRILVAELMLQRTRAAQAEAVWIEFVGAYPTLREAARAPRGDLLRVLRPLGLEHRIDRLQPVLQFIEKHHGGIVPSGEGELTSLDGVGPYAAAAVRSFAFGKRAVLIDSNVVRIYARFFGLNHNDGLRRSAQLRSIASDMLPRSHTREFNWALIDFGAVVCRPRKPACPDCPLRLGCTYARRD